MMVFIAVDHDRAAGLRQVGRSDEDFAAFAATGQMITAHGYRPDEREDADYAAQVYASVAGLPASKDPFRLVIAADVPIARVRDGRSDADYGAILVSGLDWADVTAVFVDGAAADEAVRAAREAIAATQDHDLDTILDLPAVTALTDDHELLWHTPDEDW
jgi:hypothetical protein